MYRALTVDSERYELTPADVADLLGVARQTVSRWAREGELPHLTTPGGWHRFRRSDVDAFIERLHQAQTAPGAEAS